MDIGDIDEKKLEEYKSNYAQYKEYINKLARLKEEKKLLKGGVLLYIVLVVLFLSIFGISFIVSSSTVISIIITLYLASFAIDSSHDFLINILNSGKLKKLKTEIISIEKLKTETYNKLNPFESEIRDNLQAQLQEYFLENLYKKRSGNLEFEESLLQFESMIDEVKNLNTIMVTARVLVYEQEQYILKRKINHSFQSSKPIEELTKVKRLVNSIKNPTIPKAIVVTPPQHLYRNGKKIDNWDEINKRRRLTGLKGEEIAIAIEQEYLESVNRGDLANKVRHTAKVEGDGLGYDVLSFFSNGNEKYIEVKSTTQSLKSPFYISRNELAFLNEHKDDYFIYRILVSTDNNNSPVIEAYSSEDILSMYDIVPIQYLVKAK